MRSRILLLLAIPPLLALVEAARFYHDNKTYELHVPASYDPHKSAPLVISLHAAGLWASTQSRISGWNQVADENGFIVVYPSAIKAHGLNVWGPEDVIRIGALIDSLSARYNIDQHRIYVNGLSNGGGMSFLLSCAMPQRIAAVGIVASAQTFPWQVCKDSPPMPVIAFHGTADPATPYLGGKSWVGPQAFPGIPQFIETWSHRNHCSRSKTREKVADDVVRDTYENCNVVLYTVLGGGHTWPGGEPLPQWFTGRTTTSINASRIMWHFFQSIP